MHLSLSFPLFIFLIASLLIYYSSLISLTSIFPVTTLIPVDVYLYLLITLSLIIQTMEVLEAGKEKVCITSFISDHLFLFMLSYLPV